MTARAKLFFLVTVGLLLVWSYDARPIYDYLWIAYGRERDVVAEKIESPGASQLYDDVVALNTRTVAETDAYINSRPAKAVPPALAKLDFSSPAAYQASTGPLRDAFAGTRIPLLRDAITAPISRR